MIFEDVLLGLMAAAAGVLLFVELARALDDRHADRAPRNVPLPRRTATPAPDPRDAPIPPRTPSRPLSEDVERAFELYEEGQYPEALWVAFGGLGITLGQPFGAHRAPADAVALWSLAGLASLAQGDDAEAHRAFASALRTAPDSLEPGRGHRHSERIELVVSRLLAATESPWWTLSERLAALRLGAIWVRQGLAASPVDAGLIARRETLAKALAAAIGRLMSHALEHAAETLTALAALVRAEAALSDVAVGILSPEQYRDLARRLWWGYMRAGVREIEAGEFEGALSPLCHALSLGKVDPEQRRETSETMIHALEGLARRVAATARRRLREGDWPGAADEEMRFRALVERGLQQGLPREALMGALAKARPVTRPAYAAEKYELNAPD